MFGVLRGRLREKGSGVNSMERKKLETKVRALQFVRMGESIMSFSGMKEQVLKACALRINGQAQADQRQKRKARLRLYRRVALATACLLIGVCVYSVLDPVPVSTASTFFSRAKVWIGDILQLDIAMDAPPPSESQNRVVETLPQTADCKTIEEVYAAYGLTVYEPTEIPSGMKLGRVEATVADEDLILFSYRYAADENNMVVFTIEPMPDAVGISFPPDSIIHTAPAGEFYVWKTPSGWRQGTMFTNESIVSVRGTLSQDAFLKMLDTLRTVN